jgi:hypothetical protein
MIITETNLRNTYIQLDGLQKYAFKLFSEFPDKTVHKGIIVPRNYEKKFKPLNEMKYDELIRVILYYNRELERLNSRKESKSQFKKMSDFKSENIKIEHIFKTDLGSNNSEYFIFVIALIFLLVFIYLILRRQK